MDTEFVEKDSGLNVHEVIRVFESQEMPLSAKLTEMLNEHFIHQTERRGCGYTQATRVLAEFINQPRSDLEFDDFRLFADSIKKPLRDVMTHASAYGLTLTCWRNLDINPSVQSFLRENDPDKHSFSKLLFEQVEWQKCLRNIHERVRLEESLLLVSIIQDIILPSHQDLTKETYLPVLGEKPKVGSCPMAEKFFLEIAFRKIPRRGLVNVFINEHHQPLLMEKVNMGDDHSCISLKSVVLNGVRLPVGSSFAVAYDDMRVSKQTANFLSGNIIPLSDIQGFWFLRLTTLAVSPENRKRAFSTHFRQQVENDLFSPDIATLSQLKEVAEQQVASINQNSDVAGVK
jgi:hypothetical protein